MARLILSLLLSFSIYGGLYSQVVLKAPSLIQNPGDEFLLDITVDGFDSIATISFALKWDPTVIEFMDTDTFGLPPGFGDNPFNFQKIGEGLLPFLWIHSSSESTLANGSTLMRFKFKAVGSASSLSMINFVENGTTQVSANSSSGAVEVVIDTGQVQIAPVAVSNIIEMTSFLILPNPANTNIEAHFLMSQPLDLTWSIYSLSGKELIQGKINKAFGEQILKIDRDVFPNPGLHIFSVRSSEGVLTKKMIIQ